MTGYPNPVDPPIGYTRYMEVRYERVGRCLWHTNCIVNEHRSGVIKEVERRPSESLVECLHCHDRALLPAGFGGTVTVPVLEDGE